MPTLSVMTIPVMPNDAVSFAYLVSYNLLCIQSPTYDLCCLLLQPTIFYALPCLPSLLCLLSLLCLYLVYCVYYIYLVYSMHISFYVYLENGMTTML